MRFFILSLMAMVMTQTSLRAQPTITQEPTNQMVALGGTMALSVTASDPLVAYQWVKDNRLLLGATNSTLSVTNAGATNSGTYLVVVTNGSGMVISLPAIVAVGNPALLAWGNNQDGQLGDGTIANVTLPEIIVDNAVAATAGGDHSLFVTADGTLWAMGNNIAGQLGNTNRTKINLPITIAGGSNVVAVAAGSSHSLFLRSDGTLWAMGANGDGQLGDGTTTLRTNPVPVIGGTNVVAVAAGNNLSLFLKSDGTLWAMGFGFYFAPTSVASNVVAVAGGHSQSLFLKRDGTVWMVGSSTPISGVGNVVAIATGDSHSLCVTGDGTLWAIGQNMVGQLGDGTTTARFSPVPVIGGTNVVAVAAGYLHSLFLKSDGTLWAMGYNYYGQLGNGTTDGQTTPVPVTSGAVSLAGVYSGSSAYHSLAIGQPPPPPPQPPSAATQASMPVTATDATLNGMVMPNGLPTTVWFEWGLRGSYTQTTTPVNVGAGYTVVRVSALISGLSSSNVYQCSLVASNSAGVATGAVQWFRVDNAPKVAAWGDNYYGQSQVPQNLTNVIAVAGGAATYSVVLQADGTIRGWGNDYGFGIPTSTTNVVALGMGRNKPLLINLALRSDGTVAVWGYSGTTPAGLKNVVAVAVGDSQGLALMASGQLVAWLIYSGYPNYSPGTVPSDLTNVVAIGCGASHNLVLLSNGTVVAWGNNGDGETNVPPNATNVVAIAAGSYHNLVLRADGTVVAWGSNDNGQSVVPPGLSNVVAIAAGGFHSMALKSDGTVVAWGGAGYDSNGQATVPSGLSNVVAIAAGGFHSLALGGNVPPEVLSQTKTGFVNQDLAITPSVSDANNDALTCRVAVLPAQGTLYQYAGGTRGPQITASNTTISDASFRVIYAPAPNNDGNPYTTFALVANDGQADSAPATVTINISKPPQNFTAQNLGSGLQIQFAGTLNSSYILQMATNLTPPVVWQSILTNPADGSGNWNFTITNMPAFLAGYYRATAGQ